VIFLNTAYSGHVGYIGYVSESSAANSSSVAGWAPGSSSRGFLLLTYVSKTHKVTLSVRKVDASSGAVSSAEPRRTGTPFGGTFSDIPKGSRIRYTVRTLANIVDNFKPGEMYNIGGIGMHSIEELSDVVVRVTGASPNLVEHRDSEILTTLAKRVDISKSVRDLDHKNSYGLEEGMQLTADWMRRVYSLV